MKRLFVLAVMLSCCPGDVAGQAGTSTSYETVVVHSGALELKGLLWNPAGRGPFPAVLFNHGSGPTNPARAHVLGPVFAKRGYALLFPFRRGDGLSSDQGPFIRDVLAREAAAGGAQASRRLMDGQLTQEHLDDVLAAWTLLKTLPDVDPDRLAMVGHSFGGQLTLFAAERDRTIRAAVAFAPAAQRWEGSVQLRERLVAAARSAEAPVLLIHAANDYSTKPAQAMAAERERVHKSYEMKIYPSVGATPRDGHWAVYTDVATWEGDVFRFLDQHVPRLGR